MYDDSAKEGIGTRVQEIMENGREAVVRAAARVSEGAASVEDQVNKPGTPGWMDMIGRAVRTVHLEKLGHFVH